MVPQIYDIVKIRHENFLVLKEINLNIILWIQIRARVKKKRMEYLNAFSHILNKTL